MGSKGAFQKVAEVKNYSAEAFQKVAEVKNYSAEAFQKVAEVKMGSKEAFQKSAEVEIERQEAILGGCASASEQYRNEKFWYFIWHSQYFVLGLQ